MRIFISCFIICLLPSAIFSQRGLVSKKHPRFEKHLSIPVFDELDLSRKSSKLIYKNNRLIKDSSTYYQLFADSMHKKLPLVDFSQNEIFVDKHCAQCASSCPSYRQGCHANRCNYTLSWVLLRKKVPNEIEVESQGSITGIQCKIKLKEHKNGYWIVDSAKKYTQLSKECKTPFSITNFSESILLFKSSVGDRFASFSNQVLINHKTKTVTWKEYNYWGGSRAGGIWTNWIQIPKPPKGYKIVVEEILKE
ncbi:MAG: hypothetical protein GY810_23320 [Aureispira sp.]|nr:hypothetical protein [Aureispira sp.]